jgi:hypothetical protein
MSRTAGQTRLLAERARRTLAESLRATGTLCNDKGYGRRAVENLLCPDSWPAGERDLTNSAGDELGVARNPVNPKFCAAHSLSALAATAFGRGGMIRARC